MKIKKADIIVIVGLIVLSFAFTFLISFINKSYDGDMLVVEQDGKVIQKVPLDEDQTFVVRYGNHYNKVVIKDKKASIVEADCLDQICTHMPPIEKEGETIICLPHRLFLEVETNKNKKSDKKIDKVVR